MANDPGPSFCVAPWVHAHVAADGLRRLCCIAEAPPPDQAALPLEEFHNSPYMRGIRLQMLGGTLPTDCANCLRPNRVSTYRERMNRDHAAAIEGLIADTDASGATTAQPRKLDYRTDLCNLKCRTCNDSASTRWQAHLHQHAKAYGEIGFDIRAAKARWSTSKGLRERNRLEFEALVMSGEIADVYYAGGEPTIVPGHLELLERAADAGHAAKIRVAYNTNLTAKPEFIERWLAVLSRFREVMLFVSVDGVAEIAEYVRSGLDWLGFLTTLDALLRARQPRIAVTLDPTITSLFMLEPERFANFALAYGLPISTKLMMGNELRGGALRVEFLPVHVREHLRERWRHYWSGLDGASQALLQNLDATLAIGWKRPAFSRDKRIAIMNALAIGDRTHQRGRFSELIQRDPVAGAWFSELAVEAAVQPRHLSTSGDTR